MINIVICGNEQSYQEFISRKIADCMNDKFEMKCNIICCDDLNKFKELIEKNKIDIAFLDVMLNDQNAMDWYIDNIKNNYTQIIFMTSYPQCAYNISETHCCYFLVKSRINEETLFKAFKQALQNTAKKDPNMIIVKAGSKGHVINSQDILYIETFNNSITIHIEGRESISVYSSLKDYAEKLPPNFLRCHKCYMINMNHVTGYEPHKFIMKTGIKIPIPPKKYKNIISCYETYLNNL